ncbi:MAG: helix-hairpin-helix domain-containing protein [Flavobacteriales bacterium]|nr:helix-hairpin-helix domain-containing protein [Flavobacteriales bacterium]
MRTKLFILACLLSISTYAQDFDSLNANHIFTQQIEGLSEKSISERDYSEIAENLDFLKSNKINLNTASAVELKQLPILNIFQINNLINYRERNGELFSIFELSSIHGFDKEIVRSIIPFVEIKKIDQLSWKIKDIGEVIKFGRHSFISRTQFAVQTARGHMTDSDSAQTKYRGNKYKVYSKYLFNSYDKLRFGFTMEKDAGEVFGGENSILGFDFTSFHLELKNIGIFDKLLIGDYNIEFGQGLALWSSFSTNKSSYSTDIIKLGRGIVPFSGTNENVFFRGISGTITKQNITISPFLSINKVDARLGNIKYGEYKLYESGLHRTESEIKNYNALTKTDYGINLSYDLKHSRIGIVYINTKYNNKIARGSKEYQKFDFDGIETTSIAANYLINLNTVILSGEHSNNINGAWAAIHNLSINATPELSFTISYRNYQKEYFSAYNSPFREYSSPGEVGFYLGAKGEVHKNLKFSFYFDLFEKSWLQYHKDSPTKGYETLLQLDTYINRSSSAYFRIKYEKKNKNNSSELNLLNQVLDEKKINIRLHLNKALEHGISLASRIEYVHYSHRSIENGWMIYQDIKWKSTNSPLSLYCRIAFFDTDSWNSRIYAYENDILYIFTVPSYFNQGIKYYFGANYKLNRKFSFWARIAHTEYENQFFVGSGNDQINGNQKTEIKVQMRIKL